MQTTHAAFVPTMSSVMAAAGAGAIDPAFLYSSYFLSPPHTTIPAPPYVNPSLCQLSFMTTTLPHPGSPHQAASPPFIQEICLTNSSDVESVKERSVELENQPITKKTYNCKGPQSPDHIKRPLNAFMIWSQMRRAEISSTTAKVHNSDISKILGQEWRAMTEEDKQPFVVKARELRDQHFREHPDYVYRPRRRKRLATKSSSQLEEMHTLKQTKVTHEKDTNALLMNSSGTSLLQTLLMNPIICSQLIAQMAQMQQENDLCSAQLA